MIVVVIGAGVAVVDVVGATKVVRVVSVLAAPDAIVVVTGVGVELITAVVLPGVGLIVGLIALLVVVPVFPLVELVPVWVTVVKLVGERVIWPLVVGAVLFKSDTS